MHATISSAPKKWHLKSPKHYHIEGVHFLYYKCLQLMRDYIIY